MKTIGERLKSARLAKGLTIDELQQLTKIQKKYLVALEQNDFEAMPGTFYVRSFIRQYAKAVGIDGEQLVNLLDGKEVVEELPPLETINDSRVAMHQKQHQNKYDFKKWRQRLPMIILTIASVTIVATVAYLTLREDPNQKMITKPNEVSIESEFTEENAPDESETETKQEEVAEEKPTPAKKPKPAKKKGMSIHFDGEEGQQVEMSLKKATSPLTFEFDAKDGRCWLGIQVDGAFVYEKTLELGEKDQIELPDKVEEATLVIGAADKVQIQVNNKKLDVNPNQTPIQTRNVHLTISYN